MSDSQRQKAAIQRHAAEYAEYVTDIFTNPEYSSYIIPAFLLMDSVLCALIIRTIPYTEIDWISYMQQVETYLNGERDYTRIEGDTGPLVYPALHLYIYRVLYFVTRSGSNIVIAQAIFAILYTVNLGIVMACYSLAEVPPYVYPMLVLSKRLHSIYVLRCFNDCWAMTAFYLALFMYQKREWFWGSVVYSCGLAIKMNLLLVLPSILALIYQSVGPIEGFTSFATMAQLQILLPIPFLQVNAKGYFARAFDFTREFKHRWTVNWRFVPEDRFLSREFSIGLLVVHALLLAVFLATRWLKPLGRTPGQFFKNFFVKPDQATQDRISEQLTPKFIMTTILTANTIGMLCARSLHYQFFSWIAWATPFLLWRSGMHPALQYFLWLGQEVAWNIYPSTDLSSKIVVGVLAVVVLQVWLGTDDKPSAEARKQLLAEEMKKASKPFQTRASPAKKAESTKSSEKDKKLHRIMS